MPTDPAFGRQLETFRSRLQTWAWEIAKKQPAADPAIARALVELHNALEELTVVDEDLHQQNAALLLSRQGLEEDRRRYRDLFDFAPDGYFFTDPRGNIKDVNRAAGELLKIAPQFLIGKNLLNFIADADRRITRQELLQLQQSMRSGTWTARVTPRAASSFYAALTISAISRPDGQELSGIRWMMRDVSERVRAAAEIHLAAGEVETRVARRLTELSAADAEREHLLARERAARTEAEFASRVKTHLFATLSHQLRSSLQPLARALETLEKSAPARAADKAAIKTIRHTVQAQNQLIERLLDGTSSPPAPRENDAPLPPARPAATPLSPARRRTILLVDDHEPSASSLARLLQNAGHRVVHEGSVRRAGEAARRTPFDLLLCNLTLPDGTARDFLEVLRERLPKHLVTLSADGSRDHARQSAEDGFTHHLAKPVDVEKLLAIVDNATA